MDDAIPGSAKIIEAGMQSWPQAWLELSVGVKETVDVSPRRIKRYIQDWWSYRIRCMCHMLPGMSHKVRASPS